MMPKPQYLRPGACESWGANVGCRAAVRSKHTAEPDESPTGLICSPRRGLLSVQPGALAPGERRSAPLPQVIYAPFANGGEVWMYPYNQVYLPLVLRHYP